MLRVQVQGMCYYPVGKEAHGLWAGRAPAPCPARRVRTALHAHGVSAAWVSREPGGAGARPGRGRVFADLFSAGADADRVATFLEGNNGLTKIFVHFQPQGNSKDEAKVSDLLVGAAVRGWAARAPD